MLFDKIVRRMAGADRNVRLETLLDYSGRLPDPPADLAASVDRDSARVDECQTPVFMFIGLDQAGLVTLEAEIPRESPTVRGYVSLLRSKIAGAAPTEVAAIPDDLLEKLGLAESLGMTRTQGLTAILGRIKRTVAGLT